MPSYIPVALGAGAKIYGTPNIIVMPLIPKIDLLDIVVVRA